MEKTKYYIGLLVLLAQIDAYSFCGFFVSKAGTDLFNKASKVVMVRDEDRTVLTMSNDFQGDVKEFAMVIPVPTILEKEQIHVTENKFVERVDSFTAPRLAEYYDEDPCRERYYRNKMAFSSAVMEDGAGGGANKKGAKDLGVTIEAEYTVGEYDILILSAKESDGLVTWLKQEKYKLPKGAEKVVGSYLKQGMKFFVAKVNLKEHSKTGNKYLRPLQVAYESKRFMLPIRLGMLNAKSDQELFVFAITKTGRVESSNYATVKIPSNVDIPTYIKDEGEFAKFYKDLFKNSYKKENKKAIFLEYAWNMSWCDPCAANPLTHDELKELGVFWLGKNGFDTPRPLFPGARQRPSIARATQAYVTRLHVRYNKKNFPDDLQFQVTSNTQNYQGRYIMRHKWNGDSSCDAAQRYKENLPNRLEKEAQQLANLTGRDINEIRKRMKLSGEAKPSKKEKWWKNIWD